MRGSEFKMAVEYDEDGDLIFSGGSLIAYTVFLVALFGGMAYGLKSCVDSGQRKREQRIAHIKKIVSEGHNPWLLGEIKENKYIPADKGGFAYRDKPSRLILKITSEYI